MVAPVLHVPRLEQALDQPHQPAVVDVSPDDPQHPCVIDVVVAPFDVTLDEPDRSPPRLSDLAEGRVASPAGPGAVRVCAEPLFKVWLKQRPQDFLHEFIAPGRDPQWPCPSFRFRDLHPPDSSPVVSFLSQQVNDTLDLLEAHTIDRLRGGPLRRRPGIPVDLTVGTVEEFGAEQMLVDTSQREPLGPSLLINFQECGGVLHYAYLRPWASDSPAALRPVNGFPVL